MADGIITPCNHDIDFTRWLHPAMWHVAVESWQWIHQVAAFCSVILGSRMTCRWISPVAALCNVTGGSGMTCHGIRANVCHIGILPYYRSRHAILHQSAKFLSKSDHPRYQQKKMTSCRFSRWRISVILDCRDPIMGSLKSPVKLT